MRLLRRSLAVSLSLFLCGVAPPLRAAGKPLGLLTLAYGARLNTSEAFAGLSVFPGEEMATQAEGKAMVRIGGSVATLAGSSAMTLEPEGDGAHVDLAAGSVFVTSTRKNPLAVHAEDALLRPHGAQDVQARVLLYAPKVLQVTTRTGSLDFSYHGEFRVLPEGQTYRIYLESDAAPEAQGPAGAGSGSTSGPAQTAGMSTGTKVAYFIVAGVGAGLAAWAINDVIQSNDSIESPAKP
jgi:ferric-dicitrate binding protein FerR (iron transport regulator)